MLHRRIAGAEYLAYFARLDAGVAAGGLYERGSLFSREGGELLEPARPGRSLYAAYYVRAVGGLRAPVPGGGERLARRAVYYAHGEGCRADVDGGREPRESAGRAAGARELYYPARRGVRHEHRAPGGGLGRRPAREDALARPVRGEERDGALAALARPPAGRGEVEALGAQHVQQRRAGCA